MEGSNKESNDRDDWRYRGQDEYLSGKLKKIRYYKDLNHHEHCEFCCKEISNYENALHEGYCTVDEYHWICEQCFKDFIHMIDWEVVVDSGG